MIAHRLALAVGTLVALSLAVPAADPPDVSGVRPEALGLKPVAPAKDSKTGFVVGGKNPTALIAKVTELNGKSIADLEKAMRPGASSQAGFLGADESLPAVLAADNKLVMDDWGLTHQEIALHLHLLGALAVKHANLKPHEVRYRGRTFRLRAQCYRGYQASPFEDGTRTNCDATVENVITGEKLSYSLLVPHMIERYGFYEGQGTKYRVDPRQVIKVLDFLKTAPGGQGLHP